MTLKYYLSILSILLLTSCGSIRTAPFANHHWHVDNYSGNAVSDHGMELSFGSEWMVCDTVLIQSTEQMDSFPKLRRHLAKGVAEFPEIAVDSILFYHPARGLLFVAYHQVKPLKPTSELWLHQDTVPAYSKEYARIFGHMSTYIDDDGWEDGPHSSVYTNVRYEPGKKQLVLLQRIPYRGQRIAVFQICRTRPKHGKWWKEYPAGTLWSADLGNPENVEKISSFLQPARTTAVSNLQLGTEYPVK